MNWRREMKAYEIHIAEATAKEAEIWNCGWGVNAERDWISIASKTSKGILTTNIDFRQYPKHPEVEHVWRVHS